MREIQFRGKRINYFNSKEPPKWYFGPVDITENYAQMCIHECNGWSDVYPETVGQYTGLKDKNGVEIYEGDVLKFSWSAEDGIMEMFVVVRFSVTHAAFCFWDGHFWLTFAGFNQGDMEVIGNIFDDPELEKKFGEIYRSKE